MEFNISPPERAVFIFVAIKKNFRVPIRSPAFLNIGPQRVLKLRSVMFFPGLNYINISKLSNHRCQTGSKSGPFLADLLGPTNNNINMFNFFTSDICTYDIEIWYG